MLLTAKYVIPVTAPFIEDGAVLVNGDTIVEVGKAADLKAKYPDEEVRDYGLSALSPGFVNTHTHLRMTALRGLFEDLPYVEWKRSVLRCEPFFAPEDWEASARLGALEAIASGITTVADITIPGATATAIQESGLRGVIYREVICMDPSRADDMLKQALEDIEEWRSRCDSNRVSFGIAGGSIYGTHPKVYKAIADYVGDVGIPVAMHLAGSQEEADFIRYGSSPLSVHSSEIEQGLRELTAPWLPAGVSPTRYVYNWGILGVPNMLVVHAVHVDDDDIDILRKCNVSVAHCPRINAKLAMGNAPVQKMIEEGITVGLGTDSPAAVDTTDMIDEMRVGLLLQRARSGASRSMDSMTGDTMLRMATIEAAKALRLDGWVGSLEPGKKADIIAIDMHNSHQNPTNDPPSAIIYTANQDNVKMTMVNGRILYENFVHVSGLHRDEIVEQAREIRARVRDNMNNDELREQVISRLNTEISARLKR